MTFSFSFSSSPSLLLKLPGFSPEVVVSDRSDRNMPCLFLKLVVSKFFSLGSDKNFGGCIKRKVLVFFYLLIFFFWKNSAGPFKCIIALHFSLVSSIRLWSVALAKSYLAIRSCLISIHVKFLFHFIGISRACRRAWDTGHCWTWSKSLIGSQNTKWSENMSLKREFVYDTTQLPWHG